MLSPNLIGGRSPNSGYINQEFGQRLWVSTRLMLAATILTIIIGVALGVYSAARQYKFSDRVITGYSYLVYIIPAPVAYFVVQQGATAINNIVVENGGEKIFYVTGISTPRCYRLLGYHHRYGGALCGADLLYDDFRMGQLSDCSAAVPAR